MKRVLTLALYTTLLFTACNQTGGSGEPDSTESIESREESFTMKEIPDFKIPEEVSVISITTGKTNELEIPYINAINQWNSRAVKCLSLLNSSLTKKLPQSS